MSEKYRYLKYFDFKLFIAALLLSLVGLFFIYSAGGLFFFKKQAIYFLGSLGLFFVLSCINYNIYKKSAELLYVLGLFLLILVMSSGQAVYGAQRWLSLGGFSFQPSEFMKLFLIIIIAKHLELNRAKLHSLWPSLPIFFLTVVPFVLVFKQPDLGTGVVLIVVFSAMLFWSNFGVSRLLFLISPVISMLMMYSITNYSYIFWAAYLLLLFLLMFYKKIKFFDKLVFISLNFLSGIFSPIFWANLAPYQRNRLLAFFDPEIDPLARGVRYHLVKSTIAAGSGGFFGQGLLQGPLNRLKYIPQQHTDFIFSVIAEEGGFWLSILVIVLFAYLIFKLINLTKETNDEFAVLLIVGITALFVFQVFVNMAMNIGLMPVVGLPLPFISYGGSSLLLFWGSLGIIQSIVMRKNRLMF